MYVDKNIGLERSKHFDVPKVNVLNLGGPLSSPHIKLLILFDLVMLLQSKKWKTSAPPKASVATLSILDLIVHVFLLVKVESGILE